MKKLSIVLPENVGDAIYLVVHNYVKGLCVSEYKISEIKETKPYTWFICLRDGNEVKIANTDFGVTAFLTREEAEAALKGDSQ